MKSLVRKIANSRPGVDIRNFFGLKPVPFFINNSIKNISISDAFPWRTDNNFITTFKYADLLNLFYKNKDSYIELIFYSKNNELIKKLIINELNYSNELLIDKEFLDGLEDFGVFYAFHRCDNFKLNNVVISNRCYVGFSNQDNLTSFVHGNFHVQFKSFDGKLSGFDLGRSSFFQNIYRIQNSFREFSKSELFFVNPTSKKIKFSIGNNKYKLNSRHSILIDVTKKEDISIISKCIFLRPIVFNYDGNFIDVHHA